ncbi:LOW QUALITY PROTEIN: uncharacterized protein LOC135482139 [Liolophura sinensis]|uniref:LOW QUALITY PROTEIN: uncharacterized protein LOC135482139 n=1 Tax=Liolophura sinensis TaxID=3198878 RepID=UPI003159061B
MLSKSQAEKKMVSSIVCTYKILKKLKLAEFARKKLGFSTHSFNAKRDGQVRERRKPNGPCRLKGKVVTFLSRDDNSRMKAGKKSTITRLGVKRQIRLLSDDPLALHSKFLMEESCKISYSLFCSLRPFHVMKPTAKDRETCQCRIHENFKFKMEACHQLKVISSSCIDVALCNITCDMQKKACMYRECPNCESKELDFDLTDRGKQVSWTAWKTKRQEWEKKVNGETKVSVTNITVKEREYGTLETLATELNNDIQRGSRHIFNITHQYKALRLLKNQLTDEEVMVHIDFSENYNCKYSEEIQSMHFGASQRQITLHTGVAYTRSKTYSFCTMSDSLNHAPAAIWAHLQPVILHLKELEPNVNVIHFISDCPATQYRNKQNFYLFSNRIFQHGFREGTWNFLEAGHGKGAADSIGAVIKRTADKLVSVQGKDIVNAEGLMAELVKVNTSVKLFLISEEIVDSLESELPSDLRPLSKTMQIHQVVTVHPGEVRHRVLSCFCKKPAVCDCFGLTTATFPVEVCIYRLIQFSVEVVCCQKWSKRYVDDDEEMEVQVMHCVGKNRYFWPMIDDAVWYREGDVVTLLRDPPRPVTKRHCEIDKRVWRLIESEMDLD